MGLLDALNSDEGMQALGLLAAAGPSATPMSFGQRLFGAMQQDQARRTEAEDRKMRQQMQQMQMQQLLRQASRQKALEDLPSQFMQPGMKPDTMDNRDVGQPGEAPIPKTQFDLGGYANELFRYDPQTALQLRASMQKDNKRTTLKPGETVFDESGKPLFGLPATPDKPDQSPIAKLVAEMNALPPGSPLRKVYQDAITKATTHQPGVSVSYGAPMIGKDASGKDVFFAPPKDPTKPPVIIGGVTPPSADKNTEDQSKAAGWLSQADNAYKNMLAAGFDKEGNPKAAAYPGPLDALEKVPGVGVAANALRTADRQKFIQASASLSEALLRAATGAGVNMDEARQKVQELTPQFGERQETTRQKMAAIPQYIQSLKVRAGSAAAKMPQAPANDSDPLGIRGN